MQSSLYKMESHDGDVALQMIELASYILRRGETHFADICI